MKIGGLTSLVVTLLACQPTPGPSVTGLPSPIAAPGVTAVPAATAGLTATTGSTSPVADGVAIDSGLLGVLPPAVAGVPVAESPEGDADALGNAALATVADRAVAAVAVDTSSRDLVYALVVRLRPGGMTEAGFRNWRDLYDAGACAGSSVSGNAATDLAGRQVFIGTCVNGLRTYHVWIPTKNLLVSASSAGERDFGATLMANLRP